MEETRRSIGVVALDAVLLVPAYLIPLMVRLEGSITRSVPPESRTSFLATFRGFIFVIIAIHLLTNVSFGLYGREAPSVASEVRRVVLAGLTGGGLVLIADIVLGLWPYSHRPLPLIGVAIGAIVAALGFGLVRMYGRLIPAEQDDA